MFDDFLHQLVSCLHCAGMTTFIFWRSRGCSSILTAPRRQAGSCCIRHVQGLNTKSIRSSSRSSSLSECSFCSRIVALCSPNVALWRSHWASRSRLHSLSSWRLVKLAPITCRWVSHVLTAVCWVINTLCQRFVTIIYLLVSGLCIIDSICQLLIVNSFLLTSKFCSKVKWSKHGFA